MNDSYRLHMEDIASRLQGAMNAAPGRDRAEVSKITLQEAVAVLVSLASKQKGLTND